ncbi:hypothetical protein ABMA70_03785 [Halobacteriovorax sp. XZX-3]|uniref:hypothetical protein n=1 Tax=unclassified Halobacteriovorax TaxID=2639665 RepID=UPI00371D6CD6
MKFKVSLLTFISTLMLLTSCMEAANNRRSNLDSNDSEQESSDYIIENPTNPSWYAKGQYVDGALTLNSSDTGSIYLVGGIVNNYIVSQEKKNSVFCLVGSINTASSTGVDKKSQVRLMATPIKSSKSQETSLRINVANAGDNAAFCGGDNIVSYTSSGSSVLVDANEAAYSLATICPECSTSFTTIALTLHESVAGVLKHSPVPSTSVSLSNLSVTINVNGSSTTPGGSCTNTSCQQQGYNCCLNGQCVIDGEVRPETDQNSSEYKTALAEILEDANSFKNYPELFYVCPINVNPGEDDDDSNDGDPIDDANQQLLKDIEDYKCLLGQLDSCDPNLDSVRVKVWQKCGCSFEPTYIGGELQLDSRCIDYGLKAEKDANGNILNIQCDIPVIENEDRPFQNLSVLVSGKSAPHRFFSLAGTPYDDLSEIPEGTNQEGDTFYYLDDANKAGPLETSYNMNAVIGQMTLDLQQAQPAKALDVEVDKVYIVSVTSGYATPCPYCQQDAWQKVFSSQPETAKGYGLTWRGYTTDRAQIGSNTTYGNYEDTIFGRACWVPPTMLPSSHISYADAGVQRRNRLETQAAMYVNGYQRDWYGFNQGALIGSFDGVSWFSVGAGRRVRSTTQKLFLAINAPFADLAQNTNYTVSVVEDLGGQTAADYDWDFSKDPSAAGQGYGASCQYMHACNVDSDCVAKLGWEYACAQVTDVKTNWPKFDIDAFERNNYSREGVSLSSILNTNISSGQNKRCVYRGAGSLCKLSPTTNVKKTTHSKLLTCAPNFYCAALDSASFSKELIRSPNEPTAILYGQAASILGRPISYSNRGEELPTNIQQAIAANLSIYAATGTYGPGDVGLCVPGRSTDTTNGFESRHESEDNKNRTDYISQIASCNEDATGFNRTRSCPVFDTDGNYVTVEDATINVPSVLQNMCSAASVDTDETSSFKSIEAGLIKDILQLQTETLAANACIRRAGAVCHTNLDCGPNRLHADVARGLSPSSFGDTIAEQKYWEEELVCGQSQQEPLLNTILAGSYYNYDMGQNRCCREISKDFTMYTQVETNTSFPGYDSQNEVLNTRTTSNVSPDATGRYSRYSASETFNTSSIEMKVEPGVLPDNGQALIINETGRSNCCGGGFIRKFEDGTNNWTAGGRLNLSPTKLACLNYSMKSWREELQPLYRNNWLMEYSFMSAIGGYRTYNGEVGQPFVWLRPGDPIGSIQANINADSAAVPENINTTSPIDGRISFYPADEEGTLFNTKIAFGLYQNTGFNDTFNAPYSPVVVKPAGFNNPIAPALGADDLEQQTLAIYIPDYVNGASINDVILNYITDPDATDFSDLSTHDEAAMTEVVCPSVAGAELALASISQPAYCTVTENNLRYMFFRINNDLLSAPTPMQIGWVSFRYNFPASAFGTIPGGQKYYESIFERYELLGVPQVTYEAIRCNDEKANPAAHTSNEGRLVEGIYNEVSDPFFTDPDRIPATDPNIGTADAIDNQVYYKTDGSTIALPQIFAANDFKCCSKLGTNVTDPGSMCCSGFGVLNEDNTYECRLPSGTNINTYLNLFISSEGIVTESADMSLDPEKHYDLRTGFPLVEGANADQVKSKLNQIGNRFCQLGKVRTGSAFDNYYPQPAAGYFTEDTQLKGYNSIVDSMDDLTADDANYSSFIKGFRWNHHFYCE